MAPDATPGNNATTIQGGARGIRPAAVLKRGPANRFSAQTATSV